MRRFHGKPIDIVKLKQPVLTNLRDHVNGVRSLATYLAENESSVKQPDCYICSSAEAEKFAKIHEFTYLKCLSCSHVYTSHRYSEEALKRFYQESEYYSRITYANKETSFYRREHVARPKVEFAERYTGSEKGIWIDVGSGIGDMVSVLMEKGWRAVGLEISETSVGFAKEDFGVSLLPLTFEEYSRGHPELSGTVDAVSFIGVLEHLVNPLENLALASKMLRPGGIVMIQVPNAISFGSMVQTVFPEHVFRHMIPVEHIMLFTEQSLMKALELTGFEPQAVWFHGMDIYELVINLVLLDPRVQESSLLKAFYENMNELQFVFDKRELSDRIICIAKKKDTEQRGAL